MSRSRRRPIERSVSPAATAKSREISSVWPVSLVCSSSRLAKLTAGFPPADEKITELIRTRLASFAKAKADVAEGAKLP